MSERVYVATPDLPTATTPPPKVMALKFHTAWVHPNDSDVFDFDTVLLDFVYAAIDKENRSNADQFHIRIRDLDTNVVKSYMQNSFEYPYQFWQRSVEKRANADADDPEAEVDGAIVNARVTITPVNHKGVGKRSTFLLPLKDLAFINPATSEKNPTSLILAKFWHLYSKTPEDIYNRPKQIHIYVDVDDEIIVADKARQNEDDYRYNTIGNYKEVNQEMYRWTIKDREVYQKLDDTDVFQDMSEEEKEFMDRLVQSVFDQYNFTNASRAKRVSDPDIFKIAVENPRDHSDSIIIYIMKGTSWEL